MAWESMWQEQIGHKYTWTKYAGKILEMGAK